MKNKFHLHMDVSELAINWKRGVNVVALVSVLQTSSVKC